MHCCFSTVAIALTLALQCVVTLAQGNRVYKRFIKTPPFANSTHYWPLDYYSVRNEVKDKRAGASRSVLQNGIIAIETEQLGKVLSLDGVDDWIDIKDLSSECITSLKCERGMSVGFWMKYSSGDYIIASGGFVSSNMGPPGFRLQKDLSNGNFKLEVSTVDARWEYWLVRWSKTWTYFSFSWSKKNGLTVYYNGEARGTAPSSTIIPMGMKKTQIKSNEVEQSIVIGKPDRTQKLKFHGKFEMGHLAIWDKELRKEEMKKAFQSVIKVTPESQICCLHLMEEELIRDPCMRLRKQQEWQRLRDERLSKCLCPELVIEKCNDEAAWRNMAFLPGIPGNQTTIVNTQAIKHLKVVSACQDQIKDCKRYAKQNGYCEFQKQLQQFDCARSCHQCAIDGALMDSGGVPRFSKETLIFALVGCIGGIILLLGITIYFWKVYRTRYTGAFVPPIKTVSLLEVTDYDDRWPKKYQDTNAYQIKDVPPKKRALPIIPARQGTVGHKYQPPEFD